MLLREYAIQPQVLSNLQSVRYFLDQTGVAHGRMISRYPQRWCAMVYAACEKSRPKEKAKIEIRLKRDVARRLLPSARPYGDAGPDWIPNALHEHARRPFAGVILKDEAPGDRTAAVVNASDVDEHCRCWQVSRDEVVPRTAEDMASRARNLLRISREIVFVDYFFSGKAKYGKPLTAFLASAMDGCQPTRIEYHLQARATKAQFVHELGAKIVPYLPPLPLDVGIRFIRWKQRPQREGLHPRYVLTEHGGIRYDHGLDEGKVGETTDVALLDADVYGTRWDQYCAASTAFHFADGFEVLNGAICRIKPDGACFRNVGPP